MTNEIAKNWRARRGKHKQNTKARGMAEMPSTRNCRRSPANQGASQGLQAGFHSVTNYRNSSRTGINSNHSVRRYLRFLVHSPFCRLAKLLFRGMQWLFSHRLVHRDLNRRLRVLFRASILLFLQVFGICSCSSVLYRVFPVNNSVLLLILALGLRTGSDRPDQKLHRQE
jgi:hypothetical protein